MTGSSWLRSYSINSLLVPAPRVAAPRAGGHLVGLLRDLLDALLALFDLSRLGSRRGQAEARLPLVHCLHDCRGHGRHVALGFGADRLSIAQERGELHVAQHHRNEEADWIDGLDADV
jgi:hypothetical protein